MKNKIAEIELKYTPSKMVNKIISNSQDAFTILLGDWNQDSINLYEEFKILLLNNRNEVLGIHTLSKGGMTGTVVDLKLMFAIILKSCAVGFIVAHNHPSGKLNASESDLSIHERIQKSAEFLGLTYLDNLIIAKNDYYSLMN